MGAAPEESRRRPARRSLALKLGVSLLSFGLAIGIVEVFLRVTLRDAYHVWAPDFRWESDPDPVHMPGVSGTAHLTINSFGVRGGPFHPDQRYRILAVGGSTTLCSYLDDGEAWPHLAQERLNSALGPRATWVGNVGRLGHAATHHVLQVQRLLPQHPEIDAVIVLVGVNDLVSALNRIRVFRTEQPELFEATPKHAFMVFPGWDEESSWVQRTGIGRLLTTTRKPALPWPYNLAAQDRVGKGLGLWRRYRAQASVFHDDLPDLSATREIYAGNLEAIVDAARARGVRLIFMTQPVLWRPGLAPAERDLLWMGGPNPRQMKEGAEYYSAEALARGMEQYNDTLRRVCRERGVECLDAAARLPRTAGMFFDDAHYTEAGARRLAEIVADYLLAHEPIASFAAEGARGEPGG